ncbi:MAG: hypothetical protein LBR82_05100 [Desulfovibrio sp.]|jgi:hypothetical protein|nr:hypothetical protein [Desulfovibrio sp.]
MQPTERIIIADHSSKKWLYAVGGFIAGVAGTVAAAFFIADSDSGGTSSQVVNADEPEEEAAESHDSGALSRASKDTDEPAEGMAEPACAEDGDEAVEAPEEDSEKATAETSKTVSA